MSYPRPPNSVDDSEITLSLLLGILLRMQTSGGFWGFFLIKKKNTTTLTFHFHALEKEMATHSGILAWRIPGTREPGGLPSMGSHRVGHD